MLPPALLDDEEERAFVNTRFAAVDQAALHPTRELEPDYTTIELERDILQLLDRSTTPLCNQEIRRGLHQRRANLSKKLINSTLYRMMRRGLLQQVQRDQDTLWRRSAL